MGLAVMIEGSGEVDLTEVGGCEWREEVLFRW